MKSRRSHNDRSVLSTLGLFAFALFAFVAIASPSTLAAAQSCDDCEQWMGGASETVPDVNNDGRFTTLDMFWINRFRAITGLTTFSQDDLDALFETETDVTGDEAFSEADRHLLGALGSLLDTSGADDINVLQLLDCLQRYILGICAWVEHEDQCDPCSELMGTALLGNLDLNGDGFSIEDVAIAEDFADVLEGDVFTQEDLLSLIGVVEFGVLSRLNTLLSATGNTEIDVRQLIECMRRYLTGLCEQGPNLDATDCAPCAAMVGGEMSLFEHLDFNPDSDSGGVSGADIAFVNRFVAATGLENYTQQNLVFLLINQIDVTGNGAFDQDDVDVIRTLRQFLTHAQAETGNNTINLPQLVQCMSWYVLGLCV